MALAQRVESVMRTEEVADRQLSNAGAEVISAAEASEELRLSPREENGPGILVCRSIKAEGVKLFLALGSLLLALRVSLSYPELLYWSPLFTIFGYQFGVLLAGLITMTLLLLLWALYRAYCERYMIGPDSVLRERRHLLLCNNSTEIFYRNVNAIEVERGPYQQIMRIGRVRIGNLFSTEADIILDGVAEPEQIKRILESKVAEAIDRSNPNSLSTGAYQFTQR